MSAWKRHAAVRVGSPKRQNMLPNASGEVSSQGQMKTFDIVRDVLSRVKQDAGKKQKRLTDQQADGDRPSGE